MSWIHVLSAEELETKRIDDANAVDLAQQSKAMRTRSLLVVEPICTFQKKGCRR